MLLSGKSLARYSVEATNGSIGRIEDFYFDDNSMVIRYLVVNTNPWIPGEKKLLSPISVDRIDPVENKISVDLTKEQIQNAPPMETKLPVSRQQEREFYDYYDYGFYWPAISDSGWWGGAPFARDLVKLAKNEENKEDTADENPNLRSVREIIGEFTGYDIVAINEQVGHADNILIKNESWDIQYVITDTRKLLPGDHVIPSKAIRNIDWIQEKIEVAMTKDEIQEAPKYDPKKFTSDEEKLDEHYRLLPRL
ncbi:PRC-barrel domain-containing protein [Alteribacillus sp. HJP-4]|uniref:PRC-barrel domain-containing protein n=1 Tax=Alteribacillus sp. HJP-4 TaxID=2775394 RepID=UPI0035CD0518